VFDFNPFNFRPEGLERAAGQAEKTVRRLEQVQEELSEITGEGESEDGTVHAITDANGRLEKIVIQPRALRMASEDLAEKVTAVIRAAQDDAERRTNELVHDLVDGGAGPLPGMPGLPPKDQRE
jgi:DNA-binding protein YbaB